MDTQPEQNSKEEASKKKKAGAFSWLWPKVSDLESATEAVKTAQIAAYWMTFSYCLQLFSLFSTGSSLFGTTANDDIELYVFASIYSVMAGSFLWLGLRIRSGKFGSVPFVALWLIFEVGMKSLMAPGKGIVLNIIFLLIAIGALRGWFGIKKYRQAADV